MFSLYASLTAQTPSAARTLLLDATRVESYVVAVGERGATLRSDDDGRTWLQSASSTKSTLTAVSFAPLSLKGWAVGHQSTIISSADGGRSWKSCYDAPTKDSIFLDVLAIDANRIIAVGAFGLAMKSQDAGRSWTLLKPIDTDQHLNRITANEEGSLFIAGERGLLLRSTDSGASWEKISTPYEGSFFGVLPLEGGALLAYGLRGHIYRSDKSSAIDWKGISTPSPALLATALRLKSGVIILACQARNFLISQDGGQTFSSLSSGLTCAVAEIL